ncbi:uncharacterized protein MONOS_16527 [Monocercomonoides exilis]|uniref:uncharacterized protein n=1 Tax=Monocercomonoides exilis TaxID=2049356 RepID=UPI00355A87EB|nr:hypothetical protein MONOS_16527 [Monocercomonoides exilis]|eukprot:MONOS_16527.1-p1 / transcript=MONOS_16527.1 / gene=MONOS_16527 / organism=Monocercomonoides_exilis_PA203 / gene_product=unspecified product / transcript_product=unspecified product / location=Mono_scaffold01831:2435-2812(-) / protein_length=126 / sequence_SO=supercontig / SO=protein_coding / is_pseudo=false
MTNPQTDSDNIIQQLIDSMSTEQQTLGELMKDHLVDLFDCKKYSDKKQGQRHTGTAVDISTCEDLFVVDVDINKSLQAEQKRKPSGFPFSRNSPEMKDLFKQFMVVFIFIVSCVVIPINVRHKPR